MTALNLSDSLSAGILWGKSHQHTKPCKFSRFVDKFEIKASLSQPISTARFYASLPVSLPLKCWLNPSLTWFLGQRGKEMVAACSEIL